MVMIEHQTRALLVGVVEGLAAVVGTRAVRHVRRFLRADHVGYVLNADTLWPRCAFIGRGDPLIWCAVADPRCVAAVKMERGAVFREAMSPHLGICILLGAHWVAELIHDCAT